VVDGGDERRGRHQGHGHDDRERDGRVAAAGDTHANSVADDRSFRSSGEPKTSSADASPVTVAAAKFTGDLLKAGWLPNGARVVFLGDSITRSGGYVAFTTYYLERVYPKRDFDALGLGLASETLSGLNEDGHAGGKFPRPCLFERLGRLPEKARPEVVFAC
jgi:hypothetical protein